MKGLKFLNLARCCGVVARSQKKKKILKKGCGAGVAGVAALIHKSDKMKCAGVAGGAVLIEKNRFCKGR